MVAARPTALDDFYRARTHCWSKEEPVCLDCGLRATEEEPWAIYTTTCPGPEFVHRSVFEQICTGRHCKEHNVPTHLIEGPYVWANTKHTTTSLSEDTASGQS